MSTARDLIKGSLRLLGVLATGENPSAEEQAEAFLALNEMLDSWSNEKLVINAKTREEFSLVAGTQSYTIGTGGVFNTPRPLRIENAMLEDQSISPTIEYPVDIINEDQWAAIQIKDLGAQLPTKLYYETTSPLGVIYLYPKPTAANKLVIYPWKPLTSFASVNTTVDMPPGYYKALRYNLAVMLSPEYGRPVDQMVLSEAMESKENIKRMNVQPIYMTADSATVGRKSFNIYSGE